MKSRVGRGPELSVLVTQMAHAEGLPLPAYQSAAAAGLDLTAAIPTRKPIRLQPGSRTLVSTGLVLELPPGTEGQVRPRSGLAARHGVTVLNSPGTIDSDYRGEVQVILINLGTETVTIARGDRIAQLIVTPVSRTKLVTVEAVSKTARGAGGFGSTGVKARRPAASRISAKSAALKPASKVKAQPGAKAKVQPMRKSRKVAVKSGARKTFARKPAKGAGRGSA